jgi:hypothetical protein
VIVGVDLVAGHHELGRGGAAITGGKDRYEVNSN